MPQATYRGTHLNQFHEQGVKATELQFLNHAVILAVYC